MQTLFTILLWLFFWPVILLGYLAFWLIFVIEVPWEILGILEVILIMGFFGFLLWFDRRDSEKKLSHSMKLSWLIVTAVTAVSDLALVLLCAYFSYQMDGASSICGMFALMLPLLVGCLWFTLSFLTEFEGRKLSRSMTVVCCLIALLLPLLFGGGRHLAGLAELNDLRKTADVYEGEVVDRALSERGAYIGVEFDNGTGTCFYEVYGASFPADIAVGDRVRITASGDKAVAAEIIE